MHKRRQPVKLWYLSSFFRHERAQAGRYRQFWQVGAEALGSDDPAVDAESITLLATLLAEMRRPRGAPAPVEPRQPGQPRRVPRALQAHLRAHEDAALRGGPRAHRPQPAARLRHRPPRHARGDGERAAAARCARARGPRALRRGSRAARRRRRRLRDRPDAGPRPRLLHPHPLRVHLRGARRAERRRRRRALRRPRRAARRARHARHGLGGRHRADPAGGRGASQPRRRRRSSCSSRSRSTTPAVRRGRRSRCSPRPAPPASPRRWSSAGARSKASSARPPRSAPASWRSSAASETTLRDMQGGTQQTVASETRRARRPAQPPRDLARRPPRPSEAVKPRPLIAAARAAAARSAAGSGCTKLVA